VGGAMWEWWGGAAPTITILRFYELIECP